MRRMLSVFLMSLIFVTLAGCNLLPEIEPVNQAPFVDGSPYLAFDINVDEPDWKQYVTAKDEEDGSIRITDSMMESNVDMTKEGIYAVDFYVTDSMGKTGHFRITVEIIDNRLLEFYLQGDNPLIVAHGSVFEDPSVISQLDDGTPVAFNVNGTVDTFTLGEYILTYTTIDGEGILERTVVVEDQDAPVIDLGAYDDIYLAVGEEYVDYEYTVTDNIDTEFTVTITSNVDTSVAGVYEMSYSTSDAAGNVSEVATRSVTVLDGTYPIFMYDGEQDRTIEFGVDPFDSEVYVVYGDGLRHVVAGDTDFDETILGDFSFTYTYTDAESIAHELVRQITVVDTTPPVITLEGSTEVTLRVNDTNEGLHATATDNYDQEVTVTEDYSEVDFTTTGTYTAYYDAVDSSGNVAETIERLIHVIYHTPEYEQITLDARNDNVFIEHTLIDEDATITYMEITISEKNGTYSETVILDATSTDSLSLSGLLELTDYTIVGYYLYNLDDGFGEQKYEFINTSVSTRETLAPTYKLLDSTRTETTISVDVPIDDIDGTLSVCYIVQYLDGVEAQRVNCLESENPYIFEGLTPGTVYDFEIEMTYNKQDGNGDITVVEPFLTEYSAPIGPYPLSFLSASTDDLLLGDQIPFVVEIDNPDNVEIYSITVNGQEITDFRSSSTRTQLIFDLRSGDVPGEQTFVIDTLTVYEDDVLTSYAIGLNNELTLKVFKDVQVISVIGTDGNNIMQQGSNKDLLFTLDNTAGYDIESIMINGQVYTKDQFMSSSPTSIVIQFPGSYGYGMYRLTINEIVYSDGETSRTVENIDEQFALYVLDGTSVSYITSVQALQNMRNDGYYVLSTNLDLSGINWTPIKNFNGYFDGNGYVISNLTIDEITNENEPRDYGLFEGNNGYITNLRLENVSIKVIALNDDSSYEYRAGGIAGYNDGFITRSYVVGKIEIINAPRSYIGGLVGYLSWNGTIQESYSKGEINTSSTYESYIGGISGYLSGGRIKNTYSKMDIETIGEYSTNTGGIVGYGYHMNISYVYYDGVITQNQNNPGGILGAGSDFDIINAYAETNYLVRDMWNASVKNSYLYNSTDEDGVQYSSRSRLDVTLLTIDDYPDFRFETDGGFNASVWNFDTHFPTLKYLDNTPVYTSQTQEDTTGLPMDITMQRFESATIDGVVLGEDVPFVIEIDNTSNLPIASITINGEQITDFKGSSTNRILFIDIPSTVSGSTDFTVEAIDVVYDGQTVQYTIDENNTETVKIFNEIEILSINPLDGDPTAKQGSNKQIIIALDNPDGYIVERIMIDGKLYSKEDFITSSSNAIVVSVPMNYYYNEIARYYVNEITYNIGSAMRTVNDLQEQFAIYVYDEKIVNYINNAEDLQNMEERGYYILTRDIDLSGINWIPIEQFHGFLNGNGYTISNLTIEDVTNDSVEHKYGLIKDNFGYIVDLGLENVSIHIISLSTTYQDVYYQVGAIAAYNEGSIKRSYAVGEIEVHNVPRSFVGGLVGQVGWNSQIEESYTVGAIYVSSKYESQTGGITGYSSGGSYKNIYSLMDIEAQGENPYLGGIIGQGYHMKVTNAYYTGTITTSYYRGSGGILGAGSEFEIQHCYAEGDYLVSEMWNASVKQSYLYGSNDEDGVRSAYQSGVDITLLTTLEAFHFETEVGFDPSVWNFNEEYPQLFNVDNSPVYTSTRPEDTNGLPASINIIRFDSPSYNDLTLGETIPFVLEIDNTSNLDISSIVVNGIEITNFKELSTSRMVFFELPTMENAGDQTYTVEAINVIYNDQVETYTMTFNNELTVQIFNRVSIVSIEPTDGNVATTNYSNKELSITFDNPEGYTIERIVIDEYEFTTNDFISVSPTNIVISFPVNYGYEARKYVITSISYSDGTTTKTTMNMVDKFALYVTDTITINYINTVEDLQNIQYNSNGYYILNTDLDLSGINWTPIEHFSGYFDGNGHVIYNLTIDEITNDDSEHYYGLFRVNDGIIEDLGLEDVSITVIALNSDSDSEYRVGGIAAYNNGFIQRSYVIGRIEVQDAPRAYVGGIAGYTAWDSYIEESYTKGEIITSSNYDDQVGGIVGYTDGGFIKNVYSTMDITVNGDNQNAGGIVGYGYHMTITNSYFNGTITSNNSGGGIVGNGGYFLISNSYAAHQYIAQNLWNSTILYSYLYSNDGINYTSGSRSYVDITEVTDQLTFDFENELQWSRTIWDFSGETPTLVHVDNTPVYTSASE